MLYSAYNVRLVHDWHHNRDIAAVYAQVTNSAREKGLSGRKLVKTVESEVEKDREEIAKVTREWREEWSNTPRVLRIDRSG